jgi:hypothetical protein
MFCTKRDFLSTGIGPEIEVLGPMRSFSVIPDEPRDERGVELIGGDEQFLMVINELLLNGAIKPFDMGIHLGSSRIAMPMVFV